MSLLPSKKFQRFHDLMPHRVREVLLVSSLYHAFCLHEDGLLEEQVFFEFKELSLSSAPRFSHVTSAEEAFAKLAERQFDMVLIVPRLPDMLVADFAARVKRQAGGLPVAVLAFDNLDPAREEAYRAHGDIDAFFVWNGDPKIVLAMIKYFEDRENIDHDIEKSDVRVILLVEEHPQDYSGFLSLLYPALMRQSRALFDEGFNRLDRMMRMRTRPKILHATDLAEAEALLRQYQSNLLALIADTDVVSRRRDEGGEEVSSLDFAHKVHGALPHLPILLLGGSCRPESCSDELDATFVQRSAPERALVVERFLRKRLGFGDFVFRDEAGRELCRATDIRDLARCIRDVPDESLVQHARQNDISNWLIARSEFGLARKLRPQHADDFPSITALRDYLLERLARLSQESRLGVIADSSPYEFSTDSVFQRFGNGSLGGKARGIAFVNQLLSSDQFSGQIGGLDVRVPRSFAITTDAFDQFVQDNDLTDIITTPVLDDEIARRFQAGALPEEVDQLLRTLVDNVDVPLAVRSSSLLEDSLLHPFAGIYGTAMIPNADEDPEVRLSELRMAVKYVFSTTWYHNARAYIANTARILEEESMGVVIQEVVGQRYGDRFYPHFAGLAQSRNFYPIGAQRAEDGISQMVLGLGRMVVEGGRVVRFCPHCPGVIPQFGSPRQMMKESQSYFFAVDMSARLDDDPTRLSDNPVAHPLEAAAGDGTLRAVASTYNAQSNMIEESSEPSGPWVVTFNNILLHQSIPLAQALSELVEIGREGMGNDIEMEFACDMGDRGRRVRRGHKRRPPVLYVLQLRPILAQHELGDLTWDDVDPAAVVCRTTRALGHGRHAELRDIVYVRPDRFDASRTPDIAREVAGINKDLHDAKRRYVLIGPGRWGTSDPWLGVPVEWGDICHARIIVEASPAGYNVDPSQGTHFFQNITSLGIGYFTVPPGAVPDAPLEDSFVDWDWLQAQPAESETEHLRHIRLERPLTAFVDGGEGTGTIARG